MNKQRKELLKGAIDWLESLLSGELYDLRTERNFSDESYRKQTILNIEILKVAIEILKKEQSNEK